MNNLKITTRLAISIALLSVALLFLAHAYLSASQKGAQALESELRGMHFLSQVIKTTEAVSRYRISLFRIHAGESGFEEMAKQEWQKADAEVQVLLRLYERYEEELDFGVERLKLRHRQSLSAESLAAAWGKVREAQSDAAILPEYDRLFQRLQLLTEHVTETSGLIADEDIASYALIGVVTQHASEVIMRTMGYESAGYDAVVKGQPASHIEQLQSWDYGTFIKRDNLRLVKQGIETSNYYEVDETALLAELDSKLEAVLHEYLTYGEGYAENRIAMGEGKIIDHSSYVRNGLGFTQAMYALWYTAEEKLTYLLEARLNAELKAQRQAAVVAFGGIFLAVAFFLYVTRGIVRSLKDIEQAMDCVANGELDLEVPHLNKGDEIGSMARTLERFRRSYWWLRDEEQE